METGQLVQNPLNTRFKEKCVVDFFSLYFVIPHSIPYYVRSGGGFIYYFNIEVFRRRIYS